MVKRQRMFLPVLILLAVFLTAGVVQAALERVVDQAKVFTAAQTSQLSQAAADLGAQYAMDIVIVTISNAGGKSAQDYADDYFDYQGYGVGEERDGILLLMDFDNREVHISTSGSGIRYLTDKRIESILDDIFDGGMTAGNYYAAASAFLDSTADYLADGIPTNKLTALDGILGIIAGSGLGLGFFAGVRNQYKGHPQRAAFEYQKNSLVSLNAITDNLINTSVITRRIPRPPPGSRGIGGSSTHTSSSGRTHGGGGRGF